MQVLSVMACRPFKSQNVCHVHSSADKCHGDDRPETVNSADMKWFG